MHNADGVMLANYAHELAVEAKLGKADIETVWAITSELNAQILEAAKDGCTSLDTSFKPKKPVTEATMAHVCYQLQRAGYGADVYPGDKESYTFEIDWNFV